jgi:hypothetical protein
MKYKQCTVCRQVLSLSRYYRRPNGYSRGGACKKCEAGRTVAWGRTEKGKVSRARAKAKFRASASGIAKEKEYMRSDSRKQVVKRYHQKPSYKASLARQNSKPEHKEALRRYNKTDKRKAVLKNYGQTKKRHATLRRYHQTDKGRENAIRGMTKRRLAKAGLGEPHRPMTAKEWNAIKVAFDGMCAYCGRTDVPLTRDHVTPLIPHSMTNELPISSNLCESGTELVARILRCSVAPFIRKDFVPACRPCNSRKLNRRVSLCAYVGRGENARQ